MSLSESILQEITRGCRAAARKQVKDEVDQLKAERAQLRKDIKQIKTNFQKSKKELNKKIKDETKLVNKNYLYDNKALRQRNQHLQKQVNIFYNIHADIKWLKKELNDIIYVTTELQSRISRLIEVQKNPNSKTKKVARKKSTRK